MMFLHPQNAAAFTMQAVRDYPFAGGIAAAAHGDAIAWVRNLEGVRNVWVARAPSFKPEQVTHYKDDDGQEITQLTFASDGKRLVYVRGGDHDANWPAEGGLAPDPDSSTVQQQVTIWSVPAAGGAPVKVADGDAPALSAKGVLAYVKDNQVWAASLDGKTKPQRLFFDRGKDSDLHWSPDGSRLTFVSARGDHAFIGEFAAKEKPILYLAPSTGNDSSPRWSFDGARIAFLRSPGAGGPPEPILKEVPHPWSIWVADAQTGTARRIWQSPETLEGSFPDDELGGANLNWAYGNRMVFTAYLDGWPHLYSVAADGGTPLLLTPGDYMVEHVAESQDGRFVLFDANTGKTPDDDDRRHIYRVPVSVASPEPLTQGTGMEWTPVAAGAHEVAFVATGAQQPPHVALVGFGGGARSDLDAGAPPRDFPLRELIAPKNVSFKAADGVLVHGQLFQIAGSGTQPGIIFVHGGPPRQMLLGWHYMEYYSNAYAVNQYLAAHGFTVLSVNYRLGIGYGRTFHHPAHSGPTGAAEYQDVLAGARFLQTLSGVDGKRIGIWGGSYGGYLTALALARNSDIFKAGVDIHGVHDWTSLPDFEIARPLSRYEQGDRAEALKVAWRSSPESSMDTWKSPVLLIQGDDDRNVPFHQTVDLARRLDAQHVPYEEFVIPNEIHGFLRYASWLQADEATVAWFAKELGVK